MQGPAKKVQEVQTREFRGQNPIIFVTDCVLSTGGEIVSIVPHGANRGAVKVELEEHTGIFDMCSFRRGKCRPVGFQNERPSNFEPID